MRAWTVIGSSVTGASHRRRAQPRQDAIRWHPDGGTGPNVLLAVADGHGSSRSPRSARGAQFAVNIACDLWAAGTAGIDLAGRFVQAWSDAVRDDLRRHPIDDATPVEADAVPGAVAYGSTFLAAILGDDALLLQLGDGDIVLAEGGRHLVRPLPGDLDHHGEETSSLCLPTATELFRSRAVPLRPDEGALVLLSSDGYAKSFATDAGFLQVAADLRQMIAEHGLAPIATQLEGWLREASDDGSGDDVTVGLAWSAPCA